MEITVEMVNEGEYFGECETLLIHILLIRVFSWVSTIISRVRNIESI